MCDFGVISGPMIAMGISTAVSVAGAAASVVGQMQKQDAEVAYQGKLQSANAEQMRENRELATRAYLDQAYQANVNLAQTREATAASNFDQTIKRRQAEGSTIAAAAEGGVNGVSLNAILADFHRHEDMFLTRNEQNLLFKQQQTAVDIKGLKGQADGRISQIKPYIPGPVAPVDYFGPALSIANSGTNSYLAYKAATKPAGGNTINNYYQ